MVTNKSISAEFPFSAKFIEVHGARMHYIDEGAGEPVLFLHGNPTSSYLWRNIIPHLTPHARCIAPDLIGMGKSDKPDIGYRFFDHVKYVEGFIDALALCNFTLVLHDWGSALGFYYAMRHEANVKGIAFMEAIVRPAHWAEFPREFKVGFKLMRAPGIGWLMISVMNVFLKQIMSKSIIRTLADTEKQAYAAPFPTVGSRRPVRQWPREIPIDGTPADVHEAVSAYSEWLKTASMPKLLLAATPGAILPRRVREWCEQNLNALEVADIGPGLHYVQEDNPHGIGEALAAWYQRLTNGTHAAARQVPGK